jgi:biofilm PGA synthesis protein PgaD
MKDIIINQPNLQSFQQKCGSWFLSVLSWMLWLYFLLPLFTLGGWLMGIKNLSDEIRWFGGYKTLLELLVLYVEIIGCIGLIWLVWTAYLYWRHEDETTSEAPPVTDAQLCAAFKIDDVQLTTARRSRKVTVYFDEQALITGLDYEMATGLEG